MSVIQVFVSVIECSSCSWLLCVDDRRRTEQPTADEDNDHDDDDDSEFAPSKKIKLENAANSTGNLLIAS